MFCTSQGALERRQDFVIAVHNKIQDCLRITPELSCVLEHLCNNTMSTRLSHRPRQPFPPCSMSTLDVEASNRGSEPGVEELRSKKMGCRGCFSLASSMNRMLAFAACSNPTPTAHQGGPLSVASSPHRQRAGASLAAPSAAAGASSHAAR